VSTNADLVTSPATSTAAFLLRASDEFAGGGWIFTGFNWAVLAARVARRRGYSDFVQVLEAGAALHSDTKELLTSTTDYYETDPVTCFRGSSADVLQAIVPKCTRVLMDAANVDIQGRANSTVIGSWDHPKVRLPGGGGAPDAAYNARHLVLLHGGTNVQRIVAQVRPVTAAPHPEAAVRLVTRWGTLTLGAVPRLDVLAGTDDTDEFLSHLTGLHVDVSSCTREPARTAAELAVVDAVLDEAASAGYGVRG
jgi:glutaconate CoA-transferase, subunit B